MTRFIIYIYPRASIPPNSNHIRRFFKNLPKALHPPSLHSMVRAIVNNKPVPLPEDQLRNTFKKFDTDNDNQLSIGELTKAFQFLGSRFPGYRADRSLLHADANNDGFVNQEEMNQLVNYVAGLGFTVRRNP